jgi:hypothetical protein
VLDDPQADTVHNGLDDARDSSERLGVHIAIWCVSLLVLGWAIPALLVIGVILSSVLALIVILWMIPRFILKVYRENAGDGGILHHWRPSMLDAVRVAVVVLLKWLPFGLTSVLVFKVNGLLMKWAVALCHEGIQGSRGPAAGAESLIDKLLAGVAWPFQLVLGDSIESLRQAVGNGMHSVRDAIDHLLWLLMFLLVLEGIVSTVFLVWLTVRSILYLFGRQVLSSELSRVRRSSTDVHFRMGFAR